MLVDQFLRPRLVIQACPDGRRCPILSTGAALRGLGPRVRLGPNYRSASCSSVARRV